MAFLGRAPPQGDVIGRILRVDTDASPHSSVAEIVEGSQVSVHPAAASDDHRSVRSCKITLARHDPANHDAGSRQIGDFAAGGIHNVAADIGATGAGSDTTKRPLATDPSGVS